MPRTPQRPFWWRFPAPSVLVFTLVMGLLPWIEIGCEGKKEDFAKLNDTFPELKLQRYSSRTVGSSRVHTGPPNRMRWEVTRVISRATSRRWRGGLASRRGILRSRVSTPTASTTSKASLKARRYRAFALLNISSLGFGKGCSRG